VFQLLKGFFREMPSPLFPASVYHDALAVVTQHLKASIQELRQNELYRIIVGILGSEVDAMVERMWHIALGLKPAAGDIATSSSGSIPAAAAAAAAADDTANSIAAFGTDDMIVYDGAIVEEVRGLQAVVKQHTFSLRCALPQLEELFFKLPKAHRDTIEYLGVFASKLELLYLRKKVIYQQQHSLGIGLVGSKQTGDESIMGELASIFSPYLLRPSVW